MYAQECLGVHSDQKSKGVKFGSDDDGSDGGEVSDEGGFGINGKEDDAGPSNFKKL